MPKINVDIKHNLDKNEATDRLKGLLNQIKVEHGNMVQNLEEDWGEHNANFSFKAMGMAVIGSLNIDDSSVVVDGKIPLAALPFKTKIEDKIREEAAKLLS